MSESDTMFNERERRCAAVQLMFSTDPSYDNGTIASTLKMQIWIATNNRDVPRVMKTNFPATVMVFGVSHHATSHLRSRLESQHQSVPGCADECGDPLVQSGGRWQTLGVAAGIGTGPQVQRDPGLASEGVLRFLPFSHCPPPLPTWTRWTTSFGHTSRTSPTWPPTTPKPAWSQPSSEYSPSSPPALVEKACSQFRRRIEAKIEAEGGDFELMSALQHNQVTWIDFFNKILKIKR